ncbi:type II secretion system protein [Photobacterium nomapromontoriensis]|uniref:type II secretion system protein n=1 Tax=Photobacterium nomapromontoriensis TaxID=2910237 RepID=UPI003D117457
MLKKKGFTLIELVMVIVILGILAVTVAPKFMGVQNDARLAVFRSEAAGMKNALDIVHTKAIIGPVIDGKLDINGQLISINPDTMYPDFTNEDDMSVKEKIAAFIDIDLSHFDVSVVNDGFMLFPSTFKAKIDRECLIDYSSSRLIVKDSGCV